MIELCDLLKMDVKYIVKINNLMDHILENKIDLLKFSKIDQIIVCSIASISTINSQERLHTL